MKTERIIRFPKRMPKGSIKALDAFLRRRGLIESRRWKHPKDGTKEEAR